MEFLVGLGGYIVPFLIVLTIVVFVHEFGHYYVARWNGVEVEVFSVGFGRELFGFNDKHGTRWKFCLIPLGGYVKMLGDADASSATVDTKSAQSPNSFPAKTVGQRAAIVFAGPGANFIFAILVLSLLYVFSGRPYTPAVVTDVREGSPAAAAGILADDRITAVDGEPVESFQDLQGIVQHQAEIPLAFSILRDDRQFEFIVTPELQVITDRFGSERRVGLVGISSSNQELRPVDPMSAVGEAFAETWAMLAGTMKVLWDMIIGARSTDELGGPLRIAQISGDVAQHGVAAMFNLIAILSINLGLINLFPIPMLDGGHLVLYTIEAARGRPLNERSQEIAFRIGLAMVMTLMVFVTWNDLVHLDVIKNLTGLFS